MNYVIKNIMLAVVLSMTFTVVYADFKVNHDVIEYRADESMFYTTHLGEDNNTLNQGDQAIVRLGERVIFRSDSKKISFVPLVAGLEQNQSVANTAVQMSGIKFPEIYRQKSILYLSTVMQPDNKVNNTCRVLILHQALDEQRVKNLLKLLYEQQAEFIQEESHIVIQCKESNK